MNMRFYPGVLAGRIRIPSSKSLTHRALIAASLSCGRSVLHHPLYCDDTLATIDCLRKLGVNIKTQRDHLIVESNGRYTYHEMLDVKESATTFRLLVCTISIFIPDFTIACDSRLIERLRTRDIASLQGLTFEWKSDCVHITGSLQPTLYHVSTTITTQWASGLALAMPLGAHCLEAIATDSDYVALSIDMMKKFGVDLIRVGDSYKTVGTYQPTELEIEVDYSSSAFFVGMMVFNPQLRIEGIGTSSLQPDFRIFEYLERMGVEFHHYTRVVKVSSVQFQSCTIDLSQNPDLAPILAAVAAVSGKHIVLTGLEKLEYKESNRLVAIRESLFALGANIRIEDKSLIIDGRGTLHGDVTIDGFKDHRIIMSLVSIHHQINYPYTIIGCEHVRKSFPDFFKYFQKIGGIYESNL